MQVMLVTSLVKLPMGAEEEKGPAWFQPFAHACNFLLFEHVTGVSGEMDVL